MGSKLKVRLAIGSPKREEVSVDQAALACGRALTPGFLTCRFIDRVIERRNFLFKVDGFRLNPQDFLEIDERIVRVRPVFMAPLITGADQLGRDFTQSDEIDDLRNELLFLVASRFQQCVELFFVLGELSLGEVLRHEIIGGRGANEGQCDEQNRQNGAEYGFVGLIHLPTYLCPQNVWMEKLPLCF